MEDSHKEQHFSSPYDDSRDSDVESRLYAEIHYTNTIIGDESNLANDVINSESGNNRTRKHNSGISELESQSNLQTSQSSNHAYNQQKVPNVSEQDNAGTSSSANTVHKNPVQLDSNSNSNLKKRSLTDSGQNESTKKKKKNQKKTDNVNAENRIINPYHKGVVNDQQYGLKLLSPAFLQLLFGKSKDKKKKVAKQVLNTRAQPSKVSISYDTPTINVPQENVVLLNSVDKQVIQNETEVSGAQNSETVIDISSESSNDSTEDNSKYNSIEATDKKLTKQKIIKQNSTVNNENSDDDTSESSESIFEVPVPPKPAPPVIDLNDSDNENNESSDTDSSNSSGDDTCKGNFQNNFHRPVSNITENLQEEENSDSESSESNNLILNCTEIQKGVPSISDIKRMSRETSSKTSTVNEANATNTSDNLQNDVEEVDNAVSNSNATNASDNSQSDIEELDNAVSRERLAPPVKEINSSVTKQVSKSPQTRRTQRPAREKSYFEPMSNKMKSFYNDSWGGENFDLEKLKNQMPRDPNKWAILDDDLAIGFPRRKRYFRMVCTRCQKDDHRQNQCPEPYKPPICHMCGTKGHLDSGCPEKKCLTCGKKQNMYRRNCEQCVRMVCSRCKARGHMEHFCPDLWRAYHQTVNNTKPNVPQNTKTVMKPQHILYCCNCAKKGHDSENCRKLRWSEHFPVPSYVISYNGPEYSKENIGTESNLNNSNSFRENSITSSDSLDKTTHRNLARDKLTSFPRNQILDADKNVIFKIKSKNYENEKRMKADSFKLKIPNKNEPSKYNYWNSLSTFLYELVKESAGKFVLRQNNGQFVMEMCVASKNVTLKLQNLIQQYARRSNLERSYMFLTFDRNPEHLVQHLKDKFNEFSNMTLPKDILELHQELRSLKCEKEQQQANAFKEQKLIVCQKELLTALYREGFADDSFKRLQKLCNRFKNKIRTPGKKKFKQKAAADTSVPLNSFIQYLYHYNNVFVPHEPWKLNSFISSYKKHLERCDRLKNNPLLFPQDSNSKTDKSFAQSSSFSSTVTTENVLNSSSTSCQIPSLLLINTSTISQIQPTASQVQPMNSQTQPTISSNTSRPILSINTSISSNFHFSQNPPAVANNEEIISQIQETPSTSKGVRVKESNVIPETMKNLRKINKSRKANDANRFVKKTRRLIAQARDLNIPHLRKHVEILENKIKNGICLFKKDLTMLKALVNKEVALQKRNGR